MIVDAPAQLARIHIDREPYDSPNPTTGAALYALAGVSEHEKLYREHSGDKEDTLIARDHKHVHLTPDEHFYSQTAFTIVVNQDNHEINERHISYAQVIELYLGSGGEPSTEYLVKYSHGPVENHRGTLAPGQTVKVKNDMRFRVAGTGES